MKSLRNSILFIFLLISMNLWSKTSFITVENLAQWQEVVTIAKKSNSPIFVAVSQESKPPKIFKDRTISRLLNSQVINVFTNANSEFGFTFLDMVLSTGTESYIFLNAQELILNVHYKAFKNDEALTWIKKSLDLNSTYPDLLKKYSNNKLSTSEWVDFLNISYYNLGYAKASLDAKKLTVQITDNELNNPVFWPFILKFGIDVYHPIFEVISAQPELVKNDSLTFDWEQYYNNSYNLNLTFAVNNLDTLRLQKIITDLLPLKPNIKSQSKQIITVKQQYFEGISDWNSYMNITYSYLNKLPSDSANAYVTEATYLYQRYTNETVDSLTIKLLTDGLKKKSTFELNYSIAQVYFDRGDFERGLDFSYKAWDLTSNKQEEKLVKSLIANSRIYY